MVGLLSPGCGCCAPCNDDKPNSYSDTFSGALDPDWSVVGDGDESLTIDSGTLKLARSGSTSAARTRAEHGQMSPAYDVDDVDFAYGEGTIDSWDTSTLGGGANAVRIIEFEIFSFTLALPGSADARCYVQCDIDAGDINYFSPFSNSTEATTLVAGDVFRIEIEPKAVGVGSTRNFDVRFYKNTTLKFTHAGLISDDDHNFCKATHYIQMLNGGDNTIFPTVYGPGWVKLDDISYGWEPL